jgi:hypothetical protein
MKIDVIPLSIPKPFIHLWLLLAQLMLTESCEADKILSHMTLLMLTVQNVVLLLLQ